jgi:predicted nucleic acid-binding protein
MSRVFFDTMLLVYLLEDHPQYARRVDEILARLEERNDELYTSALAIGEILTGVKLASGQRSADDIESALATIPARILSFSLRETSHFAYSRRALQAKPADAIHLACAAAEGIDVFVTNDQKLVGKSVPGIQFIVGLDTNLF